MVVSNGFSLTTDVDLHAVCVSAPGPDVKRSTDYVSPLFRMDLAPRSRMSMAEKLLDSCSDGSSADLHGGNVVVAAVR